MRLNGTHQLLVSADSDNLLGKTHTINKNTGALLNTHKEGGLEVHQCLEQIAGQNHNMKIASLSLEFVGNLNYLGVTLNKLDLLP